MGGDHPGFVGDAEFFEHVGGVFHGGPVGFRAHDESYKRLHMQLSCDNWKAGHCMFCLPTMQHRAGVVPVIFKRLHFNGLLSAGIIVADILTIPIQE
ncbi:hypothetical protein MAALD49_14030 [Marinobacter shengliensis]|nr:hypothetical protein MAALD49_14030 [Marinobacter shengliensis]